MESTEKRVTTKPKKHANYVAVFIVLAILTGIEIAVSQMSIPKAPILIPLSLIKAATVALFYMHLRTDRNVFSALFGIGVIFGMLLILSFLILFSPAGHG